MRDYLKAYELLQKLYPLVQKMDSDYCNVINHSSCKELKKLRNMTGEEYHKMNDLFTEIEEELESNEEEFFHTQPSLLKAMESLHQNLNWLTEIFEKPTTDTQRKMKKLLSEIIDLNIKLRWLSYLHTDPSSEEGPGKITSE